MCARPGHARRLHLQPLPYVRAIIDRLADEARALQANGDWCHRHHANDTKISPGDSFANMKTFAAEHKSLPYVMDETQEVAAAYGAVCTPDFFGFNSKDELQYAGGWTNPRPRW